MSFEFEILTPTGGVPRREIAFLNVPAVGGRMTVLARHEPAICALGPGEVVARDASGTEERWNIESGTLAVSRSGAALLTQRTAALSRSK
jgi:F0F1-type ATP synthase epsilon subunit